MDKATRNIIERATQQARALLDDDFSSQLEGTFDILRSGVIASKGGVHLSARERFQRDKLVAAIEHKSAVGMTVAAAITDYVRDSAFTTLNRFVALRMLEARELVQECITKGEQSPGYREFCGMAPGVALLPDAAGYRLYMESLFDEFSTEIKVLFDRRDAASVLWPKGHTFDALLAILNADELSAIWGEDETVGWVYQFFNTGEERKKMREESQAPRNSRELAVRNQFFTPRYVVQFLTDNTLGRLWLDMHGEATRINRVCEFLVRAADGPVQTRCRKDPRDLRILDPACGSGHFLLYSFDLLLTIYEEAWSVEDHTPKSETTGRTLRDDFPDLIALRQAAPKLIVEENLYGVDIDPRCAQIAALALWLRAQRAWKDIGVAAAERPPIHRTHIVVAEPMPGDAKLIEEFAARLDPPLLGDLFKKMIDESRLAGELGILLRIEEGIATELRRAREQFVKQRRSPGYLPGLEPMPNQDVLDFSGIDDDSFFYEAEVRIVEELRAFAETAAGASGVRKRLFKDDAAQGIALVDLLQIRFDVLLMNPPFGSVPPAARSYLEIAYPGEKNDVYAAFIARAASLTTPDGAIGQITSSTGFALGHLSDFRGKYLLGQTRLRLLADLGSGVLDGATVKTAAYVLSKTVKSDSVAFTDIRGATDKEGALRRSIASKDLWRLLPLQLFRDLPGSPIAYSLLPTTTELLVKGQTLQSMGAEVNVGMMSGDDFRFLRGWWEIPADHVELWSDYEKGNGYCRFLADPVVVVKSASDFAEVGADVAKKYGSASRFIMNRRKYGVRGLVYTRITNKGLSVRLLPPRQVFSGAGLAIFLPEEAHAESLCSLLNSRCFEHVLRGISDGRKWEAGYVRNGPIPVAAAGDTALSADTNQALSALLVLLSLDETTRFFCTPPVPAVAESLHASSIESYSLALASLDFRASSLFGISDEESRTLDADVGSVSQWVERETFLTDELSWQERWRCYLIGCALGRWRASNEPAPALSWKELWENGLPQMPPLRATALSPDTILADDAGGATDIVDRMCKIAASFGQVEDPEDLRKWLKQSAFTTHLKQYSRSRRKAPMYWQFTTPSSSYSVWLYLHALTRDTFYKLQTEVAGPKLAHEERRLASLHHDLGSSPSAAERKQVAEQEYLVNELRVFVEEIKRVSPLWNADLNDGVIITCAPLWRLMPQDRDWQNELKSKWEELVAGEYDWSLIAMRLWPERVVPKCQTDRSLAIAHGLEDVFWVAGSDGKWKPKPTPSRAPAELILERSSPAVKSALKVLLESPSRAPSSRRRRTEAEGVPMS